MITTSTGAKKLESSDNWREIFPNPGTSAAGAHNASVDAADRIQPEIAPIINGKQCALGAASGDYVLLRNSTIAGKSDGAYIAAKAIPAATDIDSTYLGSAITGGIVNELNNKLTQQLTTTGLTASKCSIVSGGYAKIGNLVIVQMRVSNNSEAANRVIAGLPAYNGISQNCVEVTASDYVTSDRVRANIQPNGEMIIYNTNHNGEFITGCYLCDA